MRSTTCTLSSENGSHSAHVRDFKKRYLRDRMSDVGIHLKFERGPIVAVK